ncbi:MAG: hypothetical protein CM1200mP20_07360 [Pseudomonadota bacterium]|nr:MAG: hypothetical protein CM1200mP20_07360 [Pseudomonadota bacterium]
MVLEIRPSPSVSVSKKRVRTPSSEKRNNSTRMPLAETPFTASSTCDEMVASVALLRAAVYGVIPGTVGRADEPFIL